jgi:hypothetical protein
MSDDAASSEAYAWEKAREDVPFRRVMCPRCGQHDWHYGPPEPTDGTIVCWMCLKSEVGDE